MSKTASINPNVWKKVKNGNKTIYDYRKKDSVEEKKYTPR